MSTSLILISPTCKGTMTPRDIIRANGGFKAWVPDRAGCLWRVSYPGFRFSMEASGPEVTLTRNDSALSVRRKPPFGRKGFFYLCAQWTPDRLELFVGEGASAGEDSAGLQTSALDTVPIVPPQSLVKALRKLDLLPTAEYVSEEDLRQRVYSCLAGIQEKIDATGVPGFWNTLYDGAKIVARKPKHEPEIHPTIHALLFDQMTVANIAVHPESKTGVGDLDFSFEGSVKGEGPRSVAAEFKHAHSKDVTHGLVSQLPAYMENCGTQYGAYCVLWFKGSWWSRPAAYETSESLLDALHEAKRQTPYTDRIRIFAIDCTRPKTAGKPEG